METIVCWNNTHLLDLRQVSHVTDLHYQPLGALVIDQDQSLHSVDTSKRKTFTKNFTVQLGEN